MRQLWSRMTWGLTLACALALCAGSAQAINTNPYEQYPVRTTIGIVALVLAIVLALFTILRSWIKAGIRRRSYGEDMRYGTPMPSHKMAKKGRKRYGRKLHLPIHFTNYRGRKKQPASVGIPVPAELHRHRKITGRNPATAASWWRSPPSATPAARPAPPPPALSTPTPSATRAVAAASAASASPACP